MLSLKFLSSYIQKIHKVEQNQVITTLNQLTKDYSTMYSVLDHLEMSLFLLDQDTKPFFINSYAKKEFLLRKKIPQKSIIELLPMEEFALKLTTWIKDKELSIKEEMISQTPTQKIWNIEFYNLTLENSYIPHEQELAYILVIQNVTTTKKLQERANRLKTLESMEHLAASLAHEIKNPLTSIHLYMSLIERFTHNIESEKSDEIYHALAIVKEEVERINTITTDFLTNIRPLSLNITQIDPEKLLLSLRELVQPTLIDKKIYFQLQIEENIPSIAGDFTYIRMVLLNLIKNSIESFDDWYNVKAQKEITIKVEENSPFIEILVSDNGNGIPKEFLGQVFEPYFTTKKTGTGIGLSLSHKIISEHRGDIFIESSMKGTQVRILLPVYQGLIHKFLTDGKDSSLE